MPGASGSLGFIAGSGIQSMSRARCGAREGLGAALPRAALVGSPRPNPVRDTRGRGGALREVCPASVTRRFEWGVHVQLASSHAPTARGVPPHDVAALHSTAPRSGALSGAPVAVPAYSSPSSPAAWFRLCWASTMAFCISCMSLTFFSKMLPPTTLV